MSQERQWPDQAASYEEPTTSDSNRVLWQEAVDSALNDGTLTLEPAGSRTQALKGTCPRCGHQWTESVDVYFEVLGSGYDVGADGGGGGDRGDRGDRPRRQGRTLEGWYNVPCSCGEDHADRPSSVDSGCGWSHDLAIRLADKASA
jgi:hypothetical protein